MNIIKKELMPFFILGNPRSGTSLFRLMLNSHPNIVVPPECGFLQWWFLKYKNWTENDSRNQSKVELYVQDILTSRKMEGWNLDRKKLIESILLNQPINYGELSSLIYMNYQNNSGLEVFKIGDKNNYYINHLSTLNSIYPLTKYIHLIRDGRDVACSYKSMKNLNSNSVYKPSLADSIEDIANEWQVNVNKIDRFLKNKSSLKIRYEDLLDKPEKTLTNVCEFLEIEFHKQMLSFHNSKLNDEPIETLDWKMKTLEPIDKSNIKKYKHILSKKEIEIFNGINDLILKQNSYEL